MDDVTIGLRQIVGFVSDGTGMPREEVWLWAAATGSAVLSLSAVRGFMWAVDVSIDLDNRPIPALRE